MCFFLPPLHLFYSHWLFILKLPAFIVFSNSLHAFNHLSFLHFPPSAIHLILDSSDNPPHVHPYLKVEEDVEGERIHSELFDPLLHYAFWNETSDCPHKLIHLQLHSYVRKSLNHLTDFKQKQIPGMCVKFTVRTFQEEYLVLRTSFWLAGSPCVCVCVYVCFLGQSPSALNTSDTLLWHVWGTATPLTARQAADADGLFPVSAGRKKKTSDMSVVLSPRLDQGRALNTPGAARVWSWALSETWNYTTKPRAFFLTATHG